LQLALNEPGKAVASLTRAQQLDPRDREADFHLGRALLQAGRVAEARQHFIEFAQRYPTDPRPFFQIGVMAQSSRDIAGAASAYQEALRRDPKSSARNNLAWLRATAPRAQDRDGAEAVRLAESLRDEPGGQRPEVLDTLAAAYAESGDFPRAADTARSADSLAERSGDAKLATAIRQRLALYENNQPYRE
jgi:Flp pilus assembly protein TadD